MKVITSKSNTLFIALIEIFDQILALANKLMFASKEDYNKSVVIMIGEMGNGKSTTLNELIQVVQKQAGRVENE
jgi:putative ribosome biogenesis GTPase RsgA